MVPKAHQKLKTAISLDDRLTEHLKQAENHLVSALELFSGPKKPDRRVEYYQRLLRAQEAVTALYREELVRIRGPLPKKGKK